MRVLDPGHRYALRNLEDSGETILQFFKDPLLHGGHGYEGPSCQEVLRAVIDRVEELHREKPDVENAGIIYDLRHAIAGFEARALRRRVEKEGLAIDRLPVAVDGHLLLASVDTRRMVETGTGSGRSPSGAVPAEERADALPSQPSHPHSDGRQG